MPTSPVRDGTRGVHREEFTGTREEFTGYPPCATGYPPCATSSVTALPFPIPPQGALGLSSGAATTECEPSTLERVCARTRLVAFKVWETLGPGARLIRRHPVPKSYPRSPPRFGFPTFPDSACSILSFCTGEVLYSSFVSLKSGYYMRSRGAHGALRSCMNISTAYSHSRNADSRHTSTTSRPSSLTVAWGHPHAHSTTVICVQPARTVVLWLHGGNGTIAHALTTPNRTKGRSSNTSLHRWSVM